MDTTFYAVTAIGIIPCRCYRTAYDLACALGGVVTCYDPRLVFIPPEPHRAVSLAA